MSPSAAGARRRWPVTVTALTGSVYGTILASALVVALGRRESDALTIIGALIAAELVVAVAHAWSALLAGTRDRHDLVPSSGEVRRVLRYEWPVLQAAWPAVLALLPAVLGAYSVDTAVDVALTANVVVLFLEGFGLARLRQAGVRTSVAVGLVTAGLGAVLVVLKLLVK